MDGLLVVDKPTGPTSHDVVARIRKAARERRVGHTGTLDPAASGVLPIVLGRATRLARFLSGADKTYEATIRLGVQTDTYDSAGEPLGAPYDGPLPPRDAIERALDAFRGTFLQQPPVYSAKKVAGLRSYERARRQKRLRPAFARGPNERASAGQAPGRRSAEREGGPAPVEEKVTVPLNPVSVTVSNLELLDVDGPLLTVRVDCSAGFYVRSLAHDLGQRLGVGAHLVGLRRTRSGDLTLADAVSLESLETSADAVASALVPLGRMLPALTAVVLTAEGVRRARQGRNVGPFDFAQGPSLQRPAALHVRLLDEHGDLVGLAEPAESPSLLHPAVVLV
jgi:tRNA pseudouridine55 synthase